MLCRIFLNADVASFTFQKSQHPFCKSTLTTAMYRSTSSLPLLFGTSATSAADFLCPLWEGEVLSPSFAAFPSCGCLHLFWYWLEKLTLSGLPKVPFSKKISVMLSLQETDADLQLFSAVNYISFYSFRVLHWRETFETFLLSKSVKTNTCWPDQLLHCKTIKAIYSHLRIIMITAHCCIITSISPRSISSKVPAPALSPVKWPPRAPQRCFSW